MASNRVQTDMRRASDAWKCVQAVENDREIENGKYGSRARDIGAMIMTDGLGAALAFLRTKNKEKAEGKATWALYRHISLWVTQQIGGTASDDLMQLLMQNDTPYYRRATTETLAYVVWLKRFAEGEFSREIEQAVKASDDNA